MKDKFEFIENKQVFFDNLIKIVNIYGLEISDTTEMFDFLRMLSEDLLVLPRTEAIEYVNSVYTPYETDDVYPEYPNDETWIDN